MAGQAYSCPGCNWSSLLPAAFKKAIRPHYIKPLDLTMAFYEFNGIKPVVHPSAFVHPQATVTGNVIIGKDVYIGPGCALRGDWGRIVIEDGCNVQENCTVHMFPGVTVVLKRNAHIGHGAIIHGATIGENCLIGMNAVIMDAVELGPECIVGALCFIKQGEQIPARSLVVGNPSKIIRQVSDEMMQWKTEGTKLYQQLPRQCFDSLKLCEPLYEETPQQPKWQANYQPFKKS
jgi:phenylacetic acid degradation protein/carnitine operon protein CaiE